MQHLKQGKKNGNYFKILIPVLILFLSVSTGFIISCKKSTAATETAVAARGEIVQSVDVSGNVDASQSKNLSLPASGKVLKSVEKGDSLKKGSVLIEIDNRKTRLTVSQSQENIKIAESSLKQAQINYKGALDANHVAIQVAQENNNLAVQSADNAFNNLENTNGVSSASIESAQTALTNAQNSYNASINQAQTSLDQATKQSNILINQAQTSLDQATKQLNILKENSPTAVQLATSEASVANAQASYNTSVATSEASVANAQAAYNTAVNTATSSINAAAAAAAVASSEAQAQFNSENAEGAYKQALINQSITYWNTLSSLEQAKKQISATIESINTAQEQINLAKINLNIASIELENSIITMPFDGLVQAVNFKEGEYLSPAVAAVTVISSDFVIRTDIEETDIGKIKPGQEVDITLDAYPDEIVKGVVDKISPVSKNTAGVISFQVTIKPEDAKPGLLKFGISANATIYTSKIENVILVPSLAVFEENGKSYVWVLNEKKEASQIEVKTGASNFENTEIKSGVNEGDEILLSKPEQKKNSLSLMQGN
ncbi:MAG: efflux RND transporter periplasmic adaptor subunit [Actinobacteria bacterium]|nr:efflux RND transporter periplasmic adaptor subunit [Actinomycetota bacterium]